MSEDNQIPPTEISPAETVELLQNTISRLQGIVNNLTALPPTSLLPTASLETLVTTTVQLATSLEMAVSETRTPAEIITPENEFVAPTQDSPAVTPTPKDFTSKINRPWVFFSIVAGVILGILIYILQINQPQEVVEIPAREATPPTLTSPLPPTPQLELPPEGSLIAAIQTQVSEITSKYAESLILSTEANFLGSILTVKVGDDWYGLTESQQNKLANEMLLRSRLLDFKRLEIVDLEANLLARSPVVGDIMVILKREKIIN
ncbi:MAG: hypothetical protein DSM107014_11345 [Gomphosphaeria aponina SAG 52.96 = DSM 107014]|uniref:Uncharacterized protein n=1 Tax=Gomphosphaeria aponina SAG 52.96 = DSM 107014 TaxID=1521640 RepID=A0A941GQI5_9CHRO|nr:hypothetical protein [Gomphosphaeria aponina SAG 52.96 = DSM 107014]